jgi:hypothetical protein
VYFNLKMCSHELIEVPCKNKFKFAGCLPV